MQSFNTASDRTGAPVIMQLLPSLQTGGVERGAVDMCAAVSEAGGVSLVVSGGGPMVRDVERAGGKHITLPMQSKNLLVMRRNVARLAQVIREHGVHIVHARSRAPAWSARAACQRTGAHFVTTFHGTYNISWPPKRFYNSIMTKGERVIAISHFIAEHVEAEYKIDPEVIRVIHRGVDMERFDPRNVPAARVIQLANDWRLPDGIPVIMLPGRLTRWKGQTVLIEALAKMENRRFRCLIVGDDQGRISYRNELEALVRRRGLESVVHFTGPAADMPAAYMLADVVVSASTDPEAFGRVTVEAQAMGKPVIAPSHGASRELIIEDETGWLTPPGDAEALAEQLKHAIGFTTEARESLAAKAIANARARFSKERMCGATLDVYREILEHEASLPDGEPA